MKANPLGSKLYRILALGLCLGSLPLFVSCAGSAMRGHFEDYNTAYAEALNEQMLLNLARLQNGHPAYFLAIGAIDDRMTISEQASVANGGSLSSSRSATRNLSGTGTLLSKAVTTAFAPFTYSASGSASRSSSPEFQFIPLNNDAVAKQVLQPILPEVFYTLYQQGYPIDQLMRVMIERVETTLPNNQQLVLVNSPTGGTEDSYARFLRACAILRELQLNGFLSLKATNQTPEDVGPVFFGGGGAKGGAPAGGGKSSPDAEKTGPSIKDYSDAQDKGWTLTETNNSWQLGRLRETPVFMLNADALASIQLTNGDIEQVVLTNAAIPKAHRAVVWSIVRALMNKKSMSPNSLNREVIEQDVAAVSTVIGLLNEGISVQTKVSGEAQARTRLVLRSYGRAMEAVAAEQPAFDALSSASASFCSTVPDLEKHPVIRIDWSGLKDTKVAPLQSVHYAGKTYEITDAVASPLDSNARWNRDVFRLLVALSSQVTVDISKFQQRVFELRTD